MTVNLPTLHNSEKPNHFFHLTEEMLNTIDAFFYQEDQLNPNLNHDVGCLPYLNQRNPQAITLHALIATILCERNYPQPINPEEMRTLNLNDQSILCDTATHIATRIKGLILGQGISLRNFKCIEETDDTPSIEYDKLEPETKNAIKNLLDNNELRYLWTILTNLQPYVLHAPPNPHFQTNESSLILSILISLDIFEDMTKDQPQETQTTPHTLKLADFLQRDHQQQPA
jgi:hypothetical protein